MYISVNCLYFMFYGPSAWNKEIWFDCCLLPCATDLGLVVTFLRRLLGGRSQDPRNRIFVACQLQLTPAVIMPRLAALSDDAVWRLSVAYIGPKSRTERPRKTKIGTEVANVTRDWDTIFKVKRSKVKVTRPLWLAVLTGQYGHQVSDGSICVHDVYRVSTCRPGRGHIVAAARLQLVIPLSVRLSVTLRYYVERAARIKLFTTWIYSITESGTHDDLGKRWSGIDFRSERSKVKVIRPEMFSEAAGRRRQQQAGVNLSVVATTIWLQFAGHSTAYRRSWRSRWRNPGRRPTPAALRLCYLFI